MLLALALLPLTGLTAPPLGDSLLATVPEDAYVLVHCTDFAGLRARAESNDWYRLLHSEHGEPLMAEVAREIRSGTHTDTEETFAVANALRGELVFFDTGTVAGFAAEPPANREALAASMREWLPDGDEAARGQLEIAGAKVELIAWPEDIGGWSGRAGHFAAFVDHPKVLAIYSGDNSDAVTTALTDGLQGLTESRSAPLVSSYLESGGASSGGLQLFIDFTPLIDQAEAALADAVDGALIEPTRLLGLEGGTRLHASADLFPGTAVDCRARVHLPKDSLASRLADTLQPLSRTLPAVLPKGVWGLWALNWNLPLFYQRVRAAYVEAGKEESLAMADAGLQMAQGLAGVDPIEELLNQLAGDFAMYFVEPDGEESSDHWRDEFSLFGFHARLVNGDVFLGALEKLIAMGGLDTMLDLQELGGAEAYLMPEGEGYESGLDGGFACLPNALSIAMSRRVLERSLLALTGAEGASLDGSRMQAVIDENAGACYLTCIEMTPLRLYFLPEFNDDLRLPPLEEGQPVRDPFDAQLINAVRRTPAGFEMRMYTR